VIVVAGAGEGGGVLDAASGGGSDLIDGVSTGLSLCGGLSRGNGGLPGGGG
jgi:hypothetical protein